MSPDRHNDGTDAALRAVPRDIVQAHPLKHELEGRHAGEHVLGNASRDNGIRNAAPNSVRVPPSVAVRYLGEQEAVRRRLRTVIELDPEAVWILVDGIATLRKSTERDALAVDPDFSKATYRHIRKRNHLRQIGVRCVTILPPRIDEHERASGRSTAQNEGARDIAAALQCAVDRECRIFRLACERLGEQADANANCGV